MVKIIDQIINWVLVALALLLPLFFLPLTSEFYLFNKQALLIFAVGLLLFLWVLKMVMKKTLSFRKTPLDLPLIIFILAHLASTIIASPNKMEAIVGPTSLGTILALTGLYFVITNNLITSSVKFLISGVMASATILGLVALYQFLGLGEAIAAAPWLKSPLFTPSGGPLILISYLVAGLVISIILFLRKFSREEWLASVLYFVPCVFIALGLGFTLYQIIPGKETSLTILSYKDSWAIAIEAFKQNPLFGVGPGNYLSAFNRFRPVGFNAYSFWNNRFANASSFPLELLTVGGVMALGAYLFLLLKTIPLWLRSFRQEKANDFQMTILVGLVALFLIQFFLPSNFLILVFTFVFLALLARRFREEKVVSLPAKTLSSVILGVVVIFVIIVFYGWGRIWAADFYFRQSLNALAQNQGAQTYNFQIKTIGLNPFSPVYRRAYSQTNFALANSLAAKGDLSDQDRDNVTQLIQQAIREAKIAASLNPLDAVNWENLAQIYRNLINFAQGADQWTIAAYRQAIAMDPINPRIRVNLGGLFFSLQNYEAATRQFENAVNLKPDYANGLYNLAATYRERKMYQEAYLAMQAAVNLVPADSADYQKAKDEMDELAEKLPTEATPSAERPPAKPEEGLTEPQPIPSPIIEPPIELPEEAGPALPAGRPEISPSPSPSQQITPTP